MVYFLILFTLLMSGCGGSLSSMDRAALKGARQSAESAEAEAESFRLELESVSDSLAQLNEYLSQKSPPLDTSPKSVVADEIRE